MRYTVFKDMGLYFQISAHVNTKTKSNPPLRRFTPLLAPDLQWAQKLSQRGPIFVGTSPCTWCKNVNIFIFVLG